MTGMGRLGDEAAARASPMRRPAELPGETRVWQAATKGRASTAGMRHRADYDRKELQVA
jgi:hypothetical protein